MAVAFGKTAADVGTVSLVMLTVFSGQQFTRLGLVQAALLALAAGLLQTALSVAFWPVRQYGPERRALTSLYHELGRIVTEPMSPHHAPPATMHASQAQELLRNLQQDRSEESLRLQALLTQAERIRL